MVTDHLSDFEAFEHDFLGASHRVYRLGDGPPVLVLAEMPGITPRVADFARRVAAAGMTAFMPHLYGIDGASPSPMRYARALSVNCVSAEFAALRRGVTAPVTLWLRDLMRRACGWTGHPHAGVVGMCFTGGFALSMLMEPELVAPVLSQPSLPLGLSASHRSDLGVAAGDLKDIKMRVEADDVSMLVLRFSEDRLCPAARIQRLDAEFPGRVELVEIDSRPGNPDGIRRLAHSVLTEDLVDTPGHPTREALERTMDFLMERLGVGGGR